MSGVVEVRELYDSRARKYEGKLSLFKYAEVIKTVILKVQLEVPARPVFLDLGCGTGLSTESMLERFPQAQVTGLDLSPEMLRIYQKKFPSMQTILADFNSSKMPIKADSLDGIFTTGALSEYGDLERALPDCYELLKEGGFLLNLGVRNNLLGLISGTSWDYTPAGIKKFIAACEGSGFSEIAEISISFFRHPLAKMHKFVVKAVK